MAKDASKQSKKRGGGGGKKKDSADSADSEDSMFSGGDKQRTMLIIGAVLAVLVLLWYLNRQGYLRRWFSGMGTRRPAVAQTYDYSPSAPPMNTTAF